nr:hypothetical protein [Tanacetum cinerariifolium]
MKQTTLNPESKDEISNDKKQAYPNANAMSDWMQNALLSVHVPTSLSCLTSSVPADPADSNNGLDNRRVVWMCLVDSWLRRWTLNATGARHSFWSLAAVKFGTAEVLYAPERKPPRRGLNPRPLACDNNLSKVTLGDHLS